VGDDVPVDSDALLVTDFVNLKIKPAQSFRGAHRGRMYVRTFIGVSARMYMNICVCTVFLKKQWLFIRDLSQRLSGRHYFKEQHSVSALTSYPTNTERR
jgi:hypothetical protein